MEQKNTCTELGFLGLGRMGANMVERILASGKIRVVVWNRSAEPAIRLEKLGAIRANTPQEVVSLLKAPRKAVWLMLPSGEVTRKHFEMMVESLSEGDVLVDGANSNFHDTVARHSEASRRGITMLDVGVSGGIIAAQRGYPMMIGGARETFEYMLPVFQSFGISEGFDLMGPGGSGHYVKMVHNAIEYGMMQAIAEGFDLLKEGSFPALDLKKIAHLWNHGTIISSFLMEMVENGLHNGVDDLIPHVDDSGEGRWAAEEAIQHKVPFAVNSLALNTRFMSQRRTDDFGLKMVAAMRREFGGHSVKK
ncbi:NADP-dependent phosphogluconate dehydrogenase [Myxococcota bacterium]|nr:NADP-dependent phosphogluconate dehydrogenase [Myxococcota bacterium]MBU1536568.1 NADP-dependent phosphogluconate dehydrogenase [Myxococcota bacterium]